MEIKRLVDKWWKIAIIVVMSLGLTIGFALTGVYVGMNNARINSATAGIETDTTRFIAHRGYSDKYYQNSLDAYNAAAKIKVFYGIECDIWQTTDGVFVTAHDNNPFENRNTLISKSKYEDIKDLELRRGNAGSNVEIQHGVTICSYEDYLNICAKYGKLAVIELKASYDNDTLKKLIKYTEQRLPNDKIMFISFKRNVIESIFDINPLLNLMYLTIMGIDADNHMDRGYNVGVFHNTDYKSVIKSAEKNGKVTNFWTVNDKKKINKLIDAGADYITTDVIPDWL